eukprot:TRINITY_DN8697_c0_g2_i1.p2 TRINITY_DN8697_c0_g2~~TRINITY_DN8697_c0_g2_i1.p2  ORF type:complete len:102 (-),score=7.38 TRINITY_DN8697_c0_g2_i1:360-665(-)
MFSANPFWGFLLPTGSKNDLRKVNTLMSASLAQALFFAVQKIWSKAINFQAANVKSLLKEKKILLQGDLGPRAQKQREARFACFANVIARRAFDITKIKVS